jgi:hypothetical protein
LDHSALQLVVERSENWTITINGTEAKPVQGSWWLDWEFDVFDISDQVKVGMNDVTLKTDPMKIHAEIEPVYILGAFNLKPAPKGWAMTNEQPLSVGSWKEQGLPLYGHSVSYSKTFFAQEEGMHVLELGQWAGTVAAVHVNNKHAGIIMAPPYLLDISNDIQKGKNKVEVVVIGSLKNTLGPHHNNPRPGLASPWNWRRVQHFPSGSDYDLLDYGLMEDFQILVTSSAL